MRRALHRQGACPEVSVQTRLLVCYGCQGEQVEGSKDQAKGGQCRVISYAKKKKKKKVSIYPEGHRKANQEFLSRQTACLCLHSKTVNPRGQAPDFLASPT